MIEFDPEKEDANIAKHGVSLRLAERFVPAEALIRLDSRFDYGEPRWIAYQEIDGRLHVLVFTTRQGDTRAISLRKANEREQRFVQSLRTGGKSPGV